MCLDEDEIWCCGSGVRMVFVRSRLEIEGVCVCLCEMGK